MNLLFSKKRIFMLLMCIIMVMSSFHITAAAAEDEAKLTIWYQGENFTITTAQWDSMYKLRAEKHEYSSLSAGNDQDHEEYSGVLLETVFYEAGIDISSMEDDQQIRFTGADGVSRTTSVNALFRTARYAFPLDENGDLSENDPIEVPTMISDWGRLLLGQEHVGDFNKTYWVSQLFNGSTASITVISSGTEEPSPENPTPTESAEPKEPESISNASVKLSTLYYSYTGKQHTPEPVVTLNGQQLTKDTDYTVSFGSNTYPGYGYIYVNGTGAHKDNASVKFYISRTTGLKATEYGTSYIKLDWSTQPGVSGYKVYQYKSGTYKPVKTIKGSRNSSCRLTGLKAGYGYKFKVRTYKSTSGKTYYGIYSSVLSAPARPGKAVLSKVTTGSSHYVKATWKKKTATGYQIRIARDRNFKTGAKTFTIRSSGTTSKKITGLKKGKHYYVKIRAYRTYGGKTVYGAYSEVGKIRCR